MIFRKTSKAAMAVLILAVVCAISASGAYAYDLVQGVEAFSAVAGEALSVGDVVCLKASDGYAYKADADSSTVRPAIGIAGTKAASGSNVRVVTRGLFSGWSSLAEGAPAYLSTTAGAVTQTDPGVYSQPVGKAVSASRYLFDFPSIKPLTVSAQTASYTLTSADVGKLFTNTGATGTVTFTLPAAATGLGPFMVANADSGGYTVNVDPATGDQIAGATNSTGDQIQSTAQGACVTIEAVDATYWVIRSYYGTWSDAN